MKGWSVYLGYILLSAFSVLPVTLILPSLPSISESIDTPYWVLNLSITLHALLAAITQVIGGSLADKYSKKLIAFSVLTLFILGSVICALTNNIYVFLIARMIQAPIIVCFSISLAGVNKFAGKDNSSKMIAYVSAAWAIAPLVGPSIGGQLDTLFGWRSNFWFLSLIGVVNLFFAHYCLSNEVSYDGSTNQGKEIRILKSCLELVRNRLFLGYTICMIFSIGTLYVFLGWAPYLFRSDVSVGVNSSQLGIYMGLVPGGFIVGSVLAGKYFSGYSLANVILFGRTIAFIGITIGFIAIATEILPLILAFFGSCVFIGIGNGLSMASANAGIIKLRDDIPVTASSLASATTTIGGVSTMTISALVLQGDIAKYSVHAVMMFTTPNSYTKCDSFDK
ncbi:MAG: MFS transporter [Aliiglaciecola sp.]|uniref:MFS transporter n=1 Tax=Aliiglaciecola sp. TaxID=1872441 RepID=UPI003299AB88